MPSMVHRVAVEVVNKLDDALLQLVLRGNADVTKYGASGLGEEALSEPIRNVHLDTVRR